MSSFIGYTGQKNSLLTEYISSLNLGQKNKIITDNLYLEYGGRKENLVMNSLPDSSGWIVSGLPVSAEISQKPKIMEKKDWENLLSKKELNLKNIDGHFTGLKWNKDIITFFNDQLGLRDIYFIKVNSNYFFSTRLDWIAKFNKTNEINIDELSTNWMLPHQISWASILKNVIMLSPGGVVKISSGNFEKYISPWMPDFDLDSEPEEFIHTLNNF